ncbi:MAG: glycosyltransferase family 2 protein [Clostridiales bacterium]|nr:glycosyltransferase family 2 protein [Clostridiales bacterium]MDU6975019.1 glycosyltransferase family 2 protein [Clostridiales bacterium]
MKLNKITIITVSFNSEETIEDTILSVLNQDYDNLEYIIIDGGSTDNTINIIKKYQNYFADKAIPFKWISEPDEGIYDAINKGIRMADEGLIGIINSDDWYEPKLLSKVNCVYNNKSPNIIHGDLRIYTKDKKLIGTRKPNLNLSRIWEGMTLKHPTFFVEKKVYDEDGMFSTKYEISSDYEFVLRSYLKGRKFYYIEDVVSNMRLGGISNENRYKSWKEVEVICKNAGLNAFKARIYMYKRILKFIIGKMAEVSKRVFIAREYKLLRKWDEQS